MCFNTSAMKNVEHLQIDDDVNYSIQNTVGQEMELVKILIGDFISNFVCFLY